VASPIRNSLFSEGGDTKFVQYKIAFVQYLTLGIFLLLATGFWRLQIQHPEYYAELAEQNRIKSLPLLAPRGRIIDRERRTIVANYPSFSILLLREQSKNLLEHLPLISRGLDVPIEELQARLRRFAREPKYEPIVIKEDASSADLAFLEAHRDDLPELEQVMVQRRLYARNGFAAHVIGYVGEVSDEELNLPEFAQYNPGAMVGKSGLERQYNDILMGQDGLRRVMVNSIGRVVQPLEEKPAVAGKQLRLTIDLDLQTAAEVAMDGKNGAVVALDPRTGEVLAIVSRPTYDPNKFAVRITGQDWKDLVENPDHPLLDRAIQAQLAPGSIFKLINVTAGLEEGTLTPETAVNCPGGATFYGRYFKCWQKGGHGHIALHRAIVQSCDVFFYNAGQKTGIDKLAYYAEQFGMAHRTGIDLPHEEEGVMPSPEWKRRMFREKWYAGETISVAIGQGSVAITPIQMAYAIGGIASGGVWHRPHLVFPDEIRAERPDSKIDEVRRFPLKDETVEQVTLGMWGVVNEGGGTGGRARIQGVEVGGKTGSAQVASLELTKTMHAKDLLDNAWFVGTAPRRNPEIVVAALFEHGQHGYLAGPIVREVIKAYWDKRQRFNRQEYARLAGEGRQ
jgi:penicillin-binding protein 2